MSQPVWKLAANLGDVSPLEYGGCLVFVDETGAYPPEAEWIVPPSDDEADEPGAEWTVYRFPLDRCTYADGILSDNPYHPEMSAWFATPESMRSERPQDTTYLSCVASYVGGTVDGLRRDLCSDDVKTRARAYLSIGHYHGFHEFDSDPLTLTRDEANERYPHLWRPSSGALPRTTE